MKLLSRTIGLADALVVLVFISLLGAQMDKFAADPGVGWHLSTGQIVQAAWKAPQTDPFLSSPSARTWVSDQWLSDLLLFWLYQAGSWPLVYAVLTVVFALTFILVLLRGNAAICGLAMASCFGALVAFKLGQIHFILRPVVFAFLFFALVCRQIFLIYRQSLRERKSCFKSLRSGFVLLVPVFLIWANMHPSFVLGLVLLALLPLALLLDAILLGRKDSCLACPQGFAALLLLAGACLAVTFINPYFFRLHESILSLAGSEYFMRLNEEWLRPDFSEYSGRLFKNSLFMLGLSFFLAGNSKLNWGFFEFLVIAVFANFGLQSVRMLPFFGIAAALPLAEALANFGNAKFFSSWGTARRLKDMLGNLERREQRTACGTAVAVAAGAAVLAGAILTGGLPGAAVEYGPPSAKYPYAALDYVSNTLAPGQTAVLAARPDWGGFITWRGAGRIKAIIDDRNTMLGEGFYREFFDNMRPGGHWREFLRQFKTTHLLLEPGSPLAGALLECRSLEVLYQDKVAVLFRYEPAH